MSKAGRKINAELAKVRRDWPKKWLHTRPFADNVRLTSHGSIELPATLASGCSSPTAWLVNLPEG